jgi:TonB-linked SusC/RagA family outer membrane protein
LVLFAAGVLGAGLAEAQQASITGKVTDQATNTPLVGARIQAAGTNYFAITNQQGTYTIRAVNPGSYTLRAVMLGYGSTTKPATVNVAQVTTVDFVLRQVHYKLEEIVTTATGEQLKRELGNSVSNVEAKQLVDAAPVSTLTEVLNGRVAGVVAVANDGIVGSGSRIRIRGLSSATLSNDPLLYVDGVRVSERGPALSTGNGGSSPSFLNDLNPEEIESIEIVKGPSASTLYGTQASNGVIRVTTKKGRAGTTRWTLYTENGIVQDKSDYLDIWFASDVNPGPGGSTQQCFVFVKALGGCDIGQVYHKNLVTDPATTPLRTGFRQQYGLQVNGGTEAVRFFVAGEFEDQSGTIKMPDSEAQFLRELRGVTDLPSEQLKPSALRKVNLRTNLAANLTPKLDVSLSSGYVNTDNLIPQTGDNLEGVLVGGIFGSANPDNADNPYAFARPAYGLSNTTYRKSNHFINSGNMNYRPTSWLSGRLTAGLDYIGFEDQQLARNGESCPFCGADRGIRALNRFQSYKYSGDAAATATFKLSSRIGSKTAAGLQYNKDAITVSNNRGLVLAPGAETFTGAAEKVSSEATVKTVTLGSYLEQQFSLDDKLFITGAFRIDRNSSFGANNRTAHYPKLSGSYVLMEPKDKGIVSSMRLRAAYGETGQQPNPLASIFYFSGVTNAVLAGNQPGITLGNPNDGGITGFGNLNLKPERSREYEVGFDAGLLSSRINLEVTLYRKRTKDALIDRPLAGSLGATFSRTENLGIVRNQGIEVSGFARVLESKTLQWDLGVEASSNQNRLLALAPGVPDPQGFFYRHAVGYPLYGHWATVLKSFNDANGDGLIDPTEVVVSDTAEFIGSNTPSRQIALNTTLTLWRNLRIGGQLEYKGGFKTLEVNSGFQCLAVGDCRAMNDPTAPLIEQAKVVSFTFGSYIEKADFLRLREVSLGWTLPRRFANAVGSTAATVTLTGRNLWLLTSKDFTGWDPETNTTAGLFGDGPAYNFVQPGQPRTLLVRLNLQF